MEKRKKNQILFKIYLMSFNEQNKFIWEYNF